MNYREAQVVIKSRHQRENAKAMKSFSNVRLGGEQFLMKAVQNDAKIRVRPLRLLPSRARNCLDKLVGASVIVVRVT